MAYIDRDKAIAYVEEQYRLFKDDEDKQAIVEGCVEALKFTPTADVVEVVHCGECKLADNSCAYGLVCICEQGGMQGTIVSKRDYCSCGKRRTDDEEGD